MRRYLWLFFIVPLLFLVLESCQPTPVDDRVTVVPNDPIINESVGKLFLARNKLQPGVRSLPSGLQYSVLKSGVGITPTSSDIVTVYYSGRYLDGKVFDNEHAQKNPVSIRVSALIPGWQEALKLMSPGSIWVLYIPSNLAFGERGIPGEVGPNQAVIYTVHLLTINQKPTP